MTNPVCRSLVIAGFVLATLTSAAPVRAFHSPASAAVVSAEPAITLVGGTTQRRQTVVAAVARYVTSGLLLPDLEIRFHDDRSGCHDMRGTFLAVGTTALIDLCYDGELLVLHELGHAWERFNLDDLDRERFEGLTRAPTWRSRSVVWHRRGAEIAADTLAAGLLSTRLDSVVGHSLQFERFRALTGVASPRLSEMQPTASSESAMTEAERHRMAAFEAWRSSTVDA